jgi:hypothetical protein
MKIFKIDKVNLFHKTYSLNLKRGYRSDVTSTEYLFGILPVLASLKNKKRNFHRLYIKNSKGDKESKGKLDLKNEIIDLAKKKNLPLVYLNDNQMDSMKPKSNKNTTFNHQGKRFFCGKIK